MNYWNINLDIFKKLFFIFTDERTLTDFIVQMSLEIYQNYAINSPKENSSVIEHNMFLSVYFYQKWIWIIERFKWNTLQILLFYDKCPGRMD
jgi:hypothetical protein